MAGRRNIEDPSGKTVFLSEADYAELDRRLQMFESGESKIHLWSTVKKRILNKNRRKSK